MRHTHNVFIKNVMLLGKYKNYGPKNLKWAIKKLIAFLRCGMKTVSLVGC